MTISNATLEILRNFGTINPNLVVDGGTGLKTMAEAKNILASATITEEFPVAFGVYDLNQFLAVHQLIPDVDLDFGDANVSMKNTETKSSVRYGYADKSILTFPTKDVTMPPVDAEVEITNDMIDQIRKAAGVLGHQTLSIQALAGELSLNVVDAQSSSGNEFTLVVGEVDEALEFEFDFVIPSLKLIPGDYKVSLSSKFISLWEHKTREVKYWIALEKTSTYKKA